MPLFNFKKNKKAENQKERNAAEDRGKKKQKNGGCAMCHVSDETLASIKTDKK